MTRPIAAIAPEGAGGGDASLSELLPLRERVRQARGTQSHESAAEAEALPVIVPMPIQHGGQFLSSMYLLRPSLAPGSTAMAPPPKPTHTAFVAMVQPGVNGSIADGVLRTDNWVAAPLRESPRLVQKSARDSFGAVLELKGDRSDRVVWRRELIQTRTEQSIDVDLPSRPEARQVNIVLEPSVVTGQQPGLISQADGEQPINAHAESKIPLVMPNPAEPLGSDVPGELGGGQAAALRAAPAQPSSIGTPVMLPSPRPEQTAIAPKPDPGTRVVVPFSTFGPGHQVVATWGTSAHAGIHLHSTSEQSHQALLSALASGSLPAGELQSPMLDSQHEQSSSRRVHWPAQDDDE